MTYQGGCWGPAAPYPAYSIGFQFSLFAGEALSGSGNTAEYRSLLRGMDLFDHRIIGLQAARNRC
jgi:hypothetical protein